MVEEKPCNLLEQADIPQEKRSGTNSASLDEHLPE